MKHKAYVNIVKFIRLNFFLLKDYFFNKSLLKIKQDLINVISKPAFVASLNLFQAI